MPAPSPISAKRRSPLRSKMQGSSKLMLLDSDDLFEQLLLFSDPASFTLMAKSCAVSKRTICMTRDDFSPSPFTRRCIGECSLYLVRRHFHTICEFPTQNFMQATVCKTLPSLGMVNGLQLTTVQEKVLLLHTYNPGAVWAHARLSTPYTKAA